MSVPTGTFIVTLFRGFVAASLLNARQVCRLFSPAVFSGVVFQSMQIEDNALPGGGISMASYNGGFRAWMPGCSGVDFGSGLHLRFAAELTRQ
jgi:hypothetical protein